MFYTFRKKKNIKSKKIINSSVSMNTFSIKPKMNISIIQNNMNSIFIGNSSKCSSCGH